MKTRKGRPTKSLSTTETVPGMVLREIDAAHAKYVHDMTSEEAQRELLDIFILSVMLAARIRDLSSARVVKDGGLPEQYIEGQEMIQELSTPRYVASINKILGNTPLLLNEKSATLSEMLGYSIVLDGQYVPIESTRIRERLTVL
jgi:hypothetical protein